jgi:hypothetical protein
MKFTGKGVRSGKIILQQTPRVPIRTVTAPPIKLENQCFNRNTKGGSFLLAATRITFPVRDCGLC